MRYKRRVGVDVVDEKAAAVREKPSDRRGSPRYLSEAIIGAFIGPSGNLEG